MQYGFMDGTREILGKKVNVQKNVYHFNVRTYIDMLYGVTMFATNFYIILTHWVVLQAETFLFRAIINANYVLSIDWWWSLTYSYEFFFNQITGLFCIKDAMMFIFDNVKW